MSNLKLRELSKPINCYIEICINNELDFTFKSSESTDNSSNINWKSFEKTAKYICLYEELQKKFLEVRVYKLFENNDKPQIVSIYKVDLYSLAIGPIHHSIELHS